VRALFFNYPGGRPGLALFALRAGLGIALMIQGGLCLVEWGVVPRCWPGIAAMAAGALLTAGFLTPIAASLVVLGALGFAFSLAPPCTNNLFDGKLSAIFAGIILAAIFCIGPGAFSLDARLYGRREIIIPPKSPPRG
jgi:uncharacterized membrane protein YphA (DoxX/SURF4 family)